MLKPIKQKTYCFKPQKFFFSLFKLLLEKVKFKNDGAEMLIVFNLVISVNQKPDIEETPKASYY